MGAFAQDVATERGYTRERLDDFAIASLERAMAATNNGDLDAEMAPVTVTTRQGDTVVSHDEQPFQAKLDKIRQLRPAFAKDGTITAANSSSISDGASALILASHEAAQRHGVKPLAKCWDTPPTHVIPANLPLPL